jgi:hypothetical protein
MCPNTRIDVGTFANPTANDTRIVHGDVPLMVLRSNVEVRCGLDGSVHNSCALVGGFVQLLMQHVAILSESPYYYVVSNRTDNVTIRGMTFTGNILSDPIFGGASVAISHAGRNFQMIDCLWENITSPTGLIHLGTNSYQLLSGSEDLASGTMDVILDRCTFRNVIYDGLLIFVDHQNLTMIGTRFETIQLSPYQQPCREPRMESCQGLVYCLEDSVCVLHDICVDGLEYAASSAVLMASETSILHLLGSFSFRGLEKRLPLGTTTPTTSSSSSSSNTTEPGLCESGMSRSATNYLTTYECLEEGASGSWSLTATCPPWM